MLANKIALNGAKTKQQSAKKLQENHSQQRHRPRWAVRRVNLVTCANKHKEKM